MSLTPREQHRRRLLAQIVEETKDEILEKPFTPITRTKIEKLRAWKYGDMPKLTRRQNMGIWAFIDLNQTHIDEFHGQVFDFQHNYDLGLLKARHVRRWHRSPIPR